MICASVERCAGIDVGKRWLSVCVMVGGLEEEPRTEKRRYGTTRPELEQLRQWLVAEAVTHVVMESTGSYWKPVFNVVEEAVTVYLAQPEQVKARKGHKTDDKDGWWLAHLLRHAMIQPSFIPPRGQRELRDLTRRRRKVIDAATSEKNRIQKLLEDANVKIGNVLSDVFGVSGQAMLEALLKGQKTTEQIAHMARGMAKRKMPEIAQALEGHTLRDHHRQLIHWSLEHMRFLEDQLVELDQAILAKIEELGWGEQMKMVTSVPGVGENTAATVLAEIGTKMEQFPTGGDLSSWAGVCPGNNRSAGKSKGSHTTHGNKWLRSALTEGSWGVAHKKNCYLKEKFWRLTSKHAGHAAPAIVAVAHSVLLHIYEVLKTGQPYQNRQADPLNEAQKERLIQHHMRRLGKLGVPVRRPAISQNAKGRHPTKQTG